MSFDVDFANEFKKRNNEKPNGAILGEVISILPLKISIYEGKVILAEEQCYLCSNLIKEIPRKADLNIKAYSVNVTATDSMGDTISSINVNDKSDYDIEITFKDILKIGDRVLCLPTIDGQTFFVIDKVVV